MSNYPGSQNDPDNTNYPLWVAGYAALALLVFLQVR